MRVGDTFADRGALTAAVRAHVARTTPAYTVQTNFNARDSERVSLKTGLVYTEAELRALSSHQRHGKLSTMTYRCSGFRTSGCPFRVYARQVAAGELWCAAQCA